MIDVICRDSESGQQTLKFLVFATVLGVPSGVRIVKVSLFMMKSNMSWSVESEAVTHYKPKPLGICFR